MHAWVVPAMAVVSLGPAAHTVEHIIFSQWSRNGGALNTSAGGAWPLQKINRRSWALRLGNWIEGPGPLKNWSIKRK